MSSDKRILPDQKLKMDDGDESNGSRNAMDTNVGVILMSLRMVIRMYTECARIRSAMNKKTNKTDTSHIRPQGPMDLKVHARRNISEGHTGLDKYFLQCSEAMATLEFVPW